MLAFLKKKFPHWTFKSVVLLFYPCLDLDLLARTCLMQPCVIILQKATDWGRNIPCCQSPGNGIGAICDITKG